MVGLRLERSRVCVASIPVKQTVTGFDSFRVYGTAGGTTYRGVDPASGDGLNTLGCPLRIGFCPDPIACAAPHARTSLARPL